MNVLRVGVVVLCVALCGDLSAVVSATGLAGDGTHPCSAAIQRLIDENPNREIFFPDGTYLLDRPICTPADPKKSVSLKLSNYAIFKADSGWTNKEAMVRLGGSHSSRDIFVAGSCYSFTGGILDGSGRAKGLSIDSGRETRVCDVSMKNVTTGLHIKWGSNSGSSDADISNVNIVGADPSSSVGVLIEAYDNTLANMRIANVLVGVRLKQGGNMLSRIHPLRGSQPKFKESIGFWDTSDGNRYDMCYSDHFATGFRLGGGVSILRDCIAWWYKDDSGLPHTAILCEKRFASLVTNLQVGFRGKKAVNTVLSVGEGGGKGFISDIRLDESLLRPEDAEFRKYLRGVVH